MSQLCFCLWSRKLNRNEKYKLSIFLAFLNQQVYSKAIRNMLVKLDRYYRSKAVVIVMTNSELYFKQLYSKCFSVDFIQLSCPCQRIPFIKRLLPLLYLDPNTSHTVMASLPQIGQQVSRRICLFNKFKSALSTIKNIHASAH